MTNLPLKPLLAAGLTLLLAAPAQAALSVPAGGTLAIPAAGTLDLGCSALDLQGDLAVGAGQLVQATDIDLAGTLDGGSGTIALSGHWNNTGTFIPGTGTVLFSDTCATGSVQIAGATTFNNLTLSSSSGRTFVVPAGSHITVNGTLSIQGTPGSPIQLASSGAETAFITLGPDAQVNLSNATVPPNVQIGPAADNSANPIPTLGEYGLALLALLLAALAAKHMTGSYPPAHTNPRRRQP